MDYEKMESQINAYADELMERAQELKKVDEHVASMELEQAAIRLSKILGLI